MAKRPKVTMDGKVVVKVEHFVRGQLAVPSIVATFADGSTISATDSIVLSRKHRMLYHKIAAAGRRLYGTGGPR